MEKISKNIDSIASEERFKRSLRNKEARRLSGPEKTFASMIKATQTFQEGYQRGAFLVSVGNVPEEYQNINNSNKHR